MADSGLVLIKGIVARLKSFTTLTNIVGQNIYTKVPENTAFPYVKINATAEPWAAFEFSDMKHRLRVHGFSRSSVEQVLEIRESIFNALDRQEANVTLDSGNLVRLEFSGLADAFVEEDGKTWQSVVEFDIVIN